MCSTSIKPSQLGQLNLNTLAPLTTALKGCCSGAGRRLEVTGAGRGSRDLEGGATVLTGAGRGSRELDGGATVLTGAGRLRDIFPLASPQFCFFSFWFVMSTRHCSVRVCFIERFLFFSVHTTTKK